MGRVVPIGVGIKRPGPGSPRGRQGVSPGPPQPGEASHNARTARGGGTLCQENRHHVTGITAQV